MQIKTCKICNSEAEVSPYWGPVWELKVNTALYFVGCKNRDCSNSSHKSKFRDIDKNIAIKLWNEKQ